MTHFTFARMTGCIVKTALIVFMVTLNIVLGGCENLDIAGGNEPYANTGANRFHYVVRARNYTLDLADRIRGLADPQIPSIVAEAESAAQGLDNAMATFRGESPDAYQRIEQALISAAIAARAAFDAAESYGLNPPDVPNVPYFSQTFSDVHKTP